MPNWKKVIVSGSNASLNSITASNGAVITGSLLVSGSTTQTGNNSLTGNTSLTGSVNISGSTTIFGTTNFSNSSTTITGSLLVSGSTTQTGNNSLFGNTTLSGSIIISGSTTTPTTPTIKIYGDMETDGVIKFLPVSKNIDTSISGSYIYVSGSTNDLYFSQNGQGYNNTSRLRWFESNLYTGLLSGGVISASLGSTSFTITSGSALIASMGASTSSIDPYPTATRISWNNITASLINSGSSKITYVGIDSNGQLVQQIVPWGSTDINQWDTQVELGVILHLSGSVVTGVYNSPQISYGQPQQTDDFIRAFGPVKISGHTLSPSGSSPTLSIKKTGGTAYNRGANYVNNPNHPSTVVDTAANTSKIYRYYISGSTPVIDTGVANAGYTTIDNLQYVNTTTGNLASVGNSNWSIQRVFWIPNSPTNAFLVYYGNATYPTLLDAINAKDSEPFTEAPNTAANAIFVGYIIIEGGAGRDLLNSAECTIIQGGLFRAVGGVGSSGTSPISTTLEGLADVSAATRTAGDLLYYNGSSWINTKSLTSNYSITGSLNVSSGVTANLTGTASYASNADLLDGLDNTAFAQLASANTFTNNQIISGSLTVFTGSAIEFQVTNTGTKIGNIISDVHTITGSVGVSGSITATGFTGGAGSFSTLTSTSTTTLASSTATQTISLGAGATITTATKTINIGTSGVSGSTTNINIGSAVAGAVGTVTFNDNTVVTGSLTVFSGSAIDFQVTDTGTKIGNSITDIHTVTGSLNISGSVTATGFTGPLTGTASYATQALNASTASYVVTANTASYVLNAVSSSYASNADLLDGINSAAFALTGSTNRFTANQIITGSLTATGDIITQGNLIAQQYIVSSSVSYFTESFSSGSTKFGDTLDDTHQFTGSVNITGSLNLSGSSNFIGSTGTTIFSSNADTLIFSGSLTATGSSTFIGNPVVTGSLNVTAGITGSLLGTSSYASQALNASTASYVVTANTASYVLQAVSSSFATNASTASYVVTANTASYVLNAQTASYIATASYASNSNLLDGLDNTAFAQLASANTFTNNQIISGSLTVFTGSAIEFQVLNTGVKIGNLITDAHTITGSVNITGSLNVYNGEIFAGRIDNTNEGGQVSFGRALDGVNSWYIDVYGSTSTPSLRFIDVSTAAVRMTISGSGGITMGQSLAVGSINPSATVGRIDASNDVVAFSTSDIRFKENIQSIDNALEKITQIGGYTFDWKTDKELVILHGHSGHDVGVIAQEIEKVLPEVVTTRDNGYKAVKYEKLVALLIESNKELLKRIEVLESKINQ